MTTQRTVCCRVVVVDAPIASEATTDISAGRMEASAAGGEQPRFRPSEMLPWADPYIAGLVRKLQQEVREDLTREPAKAISCLGAPVADLEWPWDESPETEASTWSEAPRAASEPAVLVGAEA